MPVWRLKLTLLVGKRIALGISIVAHGSILDLGLHCMFDGLLGWFFE